MTFQAYLDDIRKATGKTPDDLIARAKREGLIGPDLTATRLASAPRRRAPRAQAKAARR